MAAGGSGDGVFYAAPAVSAPAAASISLHQSAAQAAYSAAGQTITYHYVVTNTGNGALTHITVSDPLAVSCPDTTLAVGAAETCTATHVTTSADVSARRIVNTATATGTPPTGPNVTSVSTLTFPTWPPTTAGISVVASSIFADYNKVGDHIPFKYDVTNDQHGRRDAHRHRGERPAPRLDHSGLSRSHAGRGCVRDVPQPLRGDAGRPERGEIVNTVDGVGHDRRGPPSPRRRRR